MLFFFQLHALRKQLPNSSKLLDNVPFQKYPQYYHIMGSIFPFYILLTDHNMSPVIYKESFAIDDHYMQPSLLIEFLTSYLAVEILFL